MCRQMIRPRSARTRLVNAVAVAKAGHVPAIILDFGTATTFDVVLSASPKSGKQAIYAGGVIAPGVHRSVEALVAAAANCPAWWLTALMTNCLCWANQPKVP